MTAWTGTSDSSALLPVPPTSHYCPPNCCTDAHKKKIQRCFSDFLSLEFLVHYSSKEEEKKCPRTVGGFGFSIYPPNLWLTQFIKAGVVGGPAPCFPSPRHAAGELLGASSPAQSPELRWQRRQRNLQHMLEELKQSPPPKEEHLQRGFVICHHGF